MAQKRTVFLGGEPRSTTPVFLGGETRVGGETVFLGGGETRVGAMRGGGHDGCVEDEFKECTECSEDEAPEISDSDYNEQLQWTVKMLIAQIKSRDATTRSRRRGLTPIVRRPVTVTVKKPRRLGATSWN